MIKQKFLLIILMGLFFLPTGCFDNEKTKVLKKKQTLLIYSGAGLKNVMDKIGQAYTNKTGTKVDFMYNGSGILLNQIKTSKKGDLFIPSDTGYIDDLAKIKGENFIIKKKTFAYHRAVVIISPKKKNEILSFNDLSKNNIKIALGDKNVSIGKLSEKIINQTAIKKDINKNIYVRFGTVNQVALAVSLNEADTGIVWYPNYLENKDKLSKIEFPKSLKAQEEIALGVLKFSKDKREAEKFLKYVINKGLKEFVDQGYELIKK